MRVTLRLRSFRVYYQRQMRKSEISLSQVWRPLAVTAAIVFTYFAVIGKLATDWWTDDNYSHGLIVPVLIAFIIWFEFDRFRRAAGEPAMVLGFSLITAAALMLLAGTMASVLYVQRLSLVVMAAGVLSFFFGRTLLKALLIPFVLLVLAIPLPQILFNKVALPLQLLASKIADRGIGFLGIPSDRYGNVIDIQPIGGGEIVSLEIVEACSGIRSLMTLITLGLILGYFTRERRHRYVNSLRTLIFDRDVVRTIILMAAAIPIALITNAGRVIFTGVLAHRYGADGIEGTWHDLSGSAVFICALALLLALNLALKRILGHEESLGLNGRGIADVPHDHPRVTTLHFGYVLAAILMCGLLVNWFQYRGEIVAERKPLREIPSVLGGWEQRNPDIRFDPETEKVLRADDYVMRDYYGPGKRLNLYVGFYASQRSGATYHSPLSCLPGAGWEMVDRELMEITSPQGRRILVNRYTVRQGEHWEILIYWYQGRGRTTHNEYVDKLFTSFDSVTKRRSDGGIVRIMTPVGRDPQRSLDAAIDLTGLVADRIGAFLPD